LLLTIVLLCGIAGTAMLWQRTQQSSMPMVPLVPAQPISRAGAGPTAPATDDVRPSGAGSERVEAPQGPGTQGPAADERMATLLVRVARTVGPAAPGVESVRLPDGARGDRSFADRSHPDEAIAEMEVEVLVDGTTEPPLRGITDLQGLVRFDVRGGSGRMATVRCPATAPELVRLQADDTVHVTLHLVPRLLVRGSVVDAAGRGIGGASLVLLPWAEREHGPPRLRHVGRSQSDGSFELRLAVGGSLGAEHASYAPSAMRPLSGPTDPTLPPAVTTLQLSLLTAPASLQGRVLDADGQPVAGAELEFRAAAPPPSGAVLAAPPQRARSARDGSFTVQDLRPGRIEFGARAKGHGSQRGVFEVAAGAMEPVEIRLPPACEVHGRVEDEQGTPVANARVWSGSIDDFEGAFVVTGAEGTFELRGLPPGPIALTARDGAARSTNLLARRDQVQLELQPGRTEHWVATLRVPTDEAVLRGQVVDTDGVRLPSWRVQVRSPDGGAAVRTDSGGFFHVRRPGPGPLSVSVYAPDATPPAAFAKAVLPAVDADREPLRIVVDRRQAWGAISGRVQTATGQPLPATLLVLHHERQEVARFQAAEDGTIRLDAVPPGSIDLHVEFAGHARASRLGVGVQPNVVADVGLVQLDASAALYGEVRGPDGKAPEQLQVLLLTTGGNVAGEYSAGTYRFASAPPGRHVLQVQGPGVAAANFVVELQAGVEHRRNMALKAGVLRRIVVQAPALAGPTVTLAIRQPGEAHSWSGDAAVRAEGTGGGSCEFLVYMAPGTYEAIAWAGATWEARSSVVFVPGDDSAVQLQLVLQ
jgi:hypothetical protein